ncbi:MAG: OsmC family protein [Bacteroidetes bacterium]|nr:OsmC family protein [Bacteroidota bacterium]
MKVSAVVKSQLNQHEVVVATNADQKKISIAPKASGFGSSVNGAELLLLSLATCYCNDIYREAAKRNITVQSVVVEVTGAFGAEGEPGSDFQYKPVIVSDASPEQLAALIDFTDGIAEIHQTLRKGLNVTLVK